MAEAKKIVPSAKDKEYKAERLLDYREVDGQAQYKIRWAGRYKDAKYDSWEVADGVSPDLIEEYEKRGWQYLFDIGKDIWRDYTPEDSKAVNEAFIAWQKSPNTLLAGTTLNRPGKTLFTYTIDFVKMIQTNMTHPNHTTRALRRI